MWKCSAVSIAVCLFFQLRRREISWKEEKDNWRQAATGESSSSLALCLCLYAALLRWRAGSLYIHTPHPSAVAASCSKVSEQLIPRSSSVKFNFLHELLLSAVTRQSTPPSAVSTTQKQGDRDKRRRRQEETEREEEIETGRDRDRREREETETGGRQTQEGDTERRRQRQEEVATEREVVCFVDIVVCMVEEDDEKRCLCSRSSICADKKKKISLGFP